jgi:hypothetical protein
MGRYCDVYGQQVKLTGLLAEAILEEAEDRQVWEGIGFAGVPLEPEGDDMFCLGDGPVVLDRQDVADVASLMRHKLLNGWADKCRDWGRSFNNDQPISSLQDIMGYATDVSNFERLALWLARCTDEKRLVWA